MNNAFTSTHRVKFDLFARYGAIAAAGDRHLAEFVPGAWYLKDPETVRSWHFGLTTVQWRKQDLKQRLDKSAGLLSGAQRFEIKETGEEGVRQIKALLGLGDLVTNVNLPNRGQIEGMPRGAAAETNALFSHNNVTPLAAGKLPPQVDALVLRNVSNQIAVLDAAFRQDKELAFRAFVNDPLMTASLPDAKALFDEMLQNTAAYLDGWEI